MERQSESEVEKDPTVLSSQSPLTTKKKFYKQGDMRGILKIKSLLPEPSPGKNLEKEKLQTVEEVVTKVEVCQSETDFWRKIGKYERYFHKTGDILTPSTSFNFFGIDHI